MIPHPACMMPDGAQPCEAFTALLNERDHFKAEAFVATTLRKVISEQNAGLVLALRTLHAEFIGDGVQLGTLAAAADLLRELGEIK